MNRVIPINVILNFVINAPPKKYPRTVDMIERDPMKCILALENKEDVECDVFRSKAVNIRRFDLPNINEAVDSVNPNKSTPIFTE